MMLKLSCFSFLAALAVATPVFALDNAPSSGCDGQGAAPACANCSADKTSCMTTCVGGWSCQLFPPIPTSPYWACYPVGPNCASGSQPNPARPSPDIPSTLPPLDRAELLSIRDFYAKNVDAPARACFAKAGLTGDLPFVIRYLRTEKGWQFDDQAGGLTMKKSTLSADQEKAALGCLYLAIAKPLLPVTKQNEASKEYVLQWIWRLR